MKLRRLVGLAVLTVALLLFPATTASAVRQDFPQAQEPVVSIVTEAEEGDDSAWTFRYLVPTAIVASAASVVLVVVLYGVRVRGRYRLKR